MSFKDIGKIIKTAGDVVDLAGKAKTTLGGGMPPGVLGNPAPALPSATIGTATIKKAFHDWVTLPDSTSPGDVLRAALQQDGSYEAIGLAATPAAVGGEVGRWVYFKDGAWHWSLTSGGLLGALGLGWPDAQYRGNIVQGSMMRASDMSGQPGMPEPPSPRRGGGMFGMMGDIVWGEAPQIVQTRRCRGSGRLAKDGLCYDKRFLPAAARENNPKRAIVPWSAGNHIRKATMYQKRIAKYQKSGQATSRKLFPRRRASRRKALPKGD